MGRTHEKLLLVLLMFGALGGPATTGWSQQTPLPRRASDPRLAQQRVAPPRSAQPRSVAPRSSQPRVMTRPPTATQQPSQRPAARPAAGGPQQGALPPGFPLDPQQQARVDQILKYWEHHTSKIKTYECKFLRENYDFVFGSKDEPKSKDVGTIRYKAPDKGLMRVDDVYNLNPQATEPEKRYVKQDVKFGEYWVCDGEAIYQFDARTKVLTETKLPPAMQGQAIADGPLPFLFVQRRTQ